MKNYILIICGLLMLAQSQAQNFAPVGAKWYILGANFVKQ